jgi:prepilin-type N-terminal cleavage/methylation domain-containing protein
MRPTHRRYGIGSTKCGSRCSSRRRGFSIAEIVIAVAMIAIVAAVTLPSVARYLDQQEVTTTAGTLSDLGTAIYAFRGAVGVSPGTLTQLGQQITTGDVSGCGAHYLSASTTRWTRSSTPFYAKATSVSGFPLPLGTANDLLVRTAASTSPAYLQIVIPNVRFQDAILLNDEIDGELDANNTSRSNTTGTIQWSVPASSTDRVIVTYNLSVTKGC